MREQQLASVRIEPRSVELCAMEQIVPHSADMTEKDLYGLFRCRYVSPNHFPVINDLPLGRKIKNVFRRGR